MLQGMKYIRAMKRGLCGHREALRNVQQHLLESCTYQEIEAQGARIVSSADWIRTRAIASIIVTQQTSY